MTSRSFRPANYDDAHNFLVNGLDDGSFGGIWRVLAVTIRRPSAAFKGQKTWSGNYYYLRLVSHDA